MAIRLSEVTVAIDCRLSSGIGTILRNVVPRLSPHLKKLILLGPGDLRDRWRLDGRNVEYVEYNVPVYGAAEQYGFPHRITAQADLLHVPHYNVPIWWTKPLVVTLNDLTQFQPEFGSSRVRRAVARGLIYWSLWRANALLTLSEYSRSDFEKDFGSRAHRLRVAHPGVDRRIFRPLDHGVARSHVERVTGIGKPYVLTLGSVRPHKNLSGLIKAFAVAKQRFGLNEALVIGGKREGFLTNSEFEIPERLRDEVIFTGAVGDSLLPALYAGSEAFVFPSLYEGFGIPPLEAMACEVPTLVSNRASLPEVVGDASLLVDPERTEEFAEAMTRIVSDAGLREKLINAGKSRAALFDWDRTAERYLEAYDQALI